MQQQECQYDTSPVLEEGFWLPAYDTAVRRSKSAAVKPGRGKTGELVQLLCDLITYVLPVAYFQKTMSYPQKITQAPLQPMCFGSKPSDYNLSMVK